MRVTGPSPAGFEVEAGIADPGPSGVRHYRAVVELAAELPEREAFIGRELTKLHEEGIAGPLHALAHPERSWRGEIVAVIAPNPAEPDADVERRELIFASLRAALEAGARPSRIVRGLAEASGLPRRELYEHALAVQKELGLASEG